VFTFTISSLFIHKAPIWLYSKYSIKTVELGYVTTDHNIIRLQYRPINYKTSNNPSNLPTKTNNKESESHPGMKGYGVN